MKIHGGNAPKGFVDFSAPRNPTPPTRLLERLLLEAVEGRIWERYPDPSYSRLREAIGEYLGIEPDAIVPLNGAAEAYSLLPLVSSVEKIVVLAPSFGDHVDHALASEKPLYMLHYRLEIGPRPRYTLGLDDVESWRSILQGSLVYFSNPNNPTGACLERSIVEALAEAVGSKGLLVVDEAFQPLSWRCPSILPEPPDNTIVLISFTKLLAAPGLRIGALIDPKGLIAKRLELARQPWNVNSIAAYVLEQLLTEYRNMLLESLEEGRRVAQAEYERLTRALEGMGCRVYESTAPYMLVEHRVPHPEAGERLARHRVWVRSMEGYEPLTPFHSRIAILGERLDDKLLEAFRATGLCDSHPGSTPPNIPAPSFTIQPLNKP